MKLYNIILKSESIYLSNDMLYIASGRSVIGLSLPILSFVGMNPDKVVGRIRSKVGGRLITDDTKGVYRILKYVKDRRFAVPILYDALYKHPNATA